MQCPQCGTDTRVIDARPNGIGLRRRYRCKKNHRFTTYLMERHLKSGLAKIAAEITVQDPEQKAELAEEADHCMAELARKLQEVYKNWEGKNNVQELESNQSIGIEPLFGVDGGRWDSLRTG
jgi:hypothetical protein